MNRFFSGAALALSLILGCTSYAEAAPKTIKFTGSQAENSFDAIVARQVFAKVLEDSGKYKVEFYFNSALGNASTVVEGLMLGTVQVFFDSVGNMSQFAPDLAVLDAPFAFDINKFDKIRQAPIWNTLMKSGAKSGLLFLGAFPTDQRNVISRVPINTADDLLGKKNRTTNSSMHIKSNEALGLKPIPMPTSEILTGLQQGVIDSLDGNLASTINYRWADVAKYIALTGHASIIQLMAVSQDWWDELSEEDKALMIKATNEYWKAYSKGYQESRTKDIETLRKMGCDVHELPEADMQKLRQRALSITDKLTPREKELYQQLIEAQK